MAVSLSLRTRQAQVFRYGQVVDMLKLNSDELAAHLTRMSRENPLLVMRQPGGSGLSATDRIEMMAVQDTVSLYDHATQQLSGLLAQGGMLEAVVIALIEELEPSGWLGCALEEIADRLEINLELVETALRLVQLQVEPAGLFARNLEECLRLQLQDQDALSPPMEQVLASIGVLEEGGPGCLARATGLDLEVVQSCLVTIRGLNPKPGGCFSSDPTLMREPDVVVTRGAKGWQIEFSNPSLGEIDIARMPRGKSSAELAEARADARSLKEALQLRESAIRQVVQVLVDRQSAYFGAGPEALVPLTMSEVADVAGFHLSTVSRVLAGLLIEGPNGVVLAKLLCPGTVAAGADCSKPRAVSRIRALITAEDPAAPISDRSIVATLRDEGIELSRRIVSKYRTELGLPPAPRRRKAS